MMKRPLIILLLIISTASVHASLVPVQSFTRKTYYDSPATLADIEEKVPFGINLKGYADLDFIRFIDNPAYALSGAATTVHDFLLSQDDQYLYDNHAEIAKLFSFDPKFPTKASTAEEDAYWIRNYLGTRYEEIGAGNRALMAMNAVSSSLNIYPENTESIFRGEGDFSLEMYGGEVKNGFSWNVGFGIAFDGASTLLSSRKSGDYTYGSDFYLTLNSDFGYGTYVSDRFAVGISVSPMLLVKTTSSNEAFLSARRNGSIIDFVSDNRFNFGLGIEMNLGLMFRPDENTKLLFDLRNIPSFQSYMYFTANDVLSGFKFTGDENIYFTAPDTSFGVMWKKGRWGINAEISDIVNQMIWKLMVSSYEFDLYAVPKLSFSFDVLEDFTLSLGYEHRYVYLGGDCGGFDFELEFMVDRVGFGVSLGYEF